MFIIGWMTMKNYKNIQTYLDSVISNPKCELNYFNDWSLLISIVLSAQTTNALWFYSFTIISSKQN